MGGWSSARDAKILAAEHETPEHVAQDGTLVCGQRVYEDRHADLRSPARLRYFVCLTGAGQCPPRERLGHPGRTATRDTPPLDMPAHDPSTMDCHQSRQQIELRDELLVLRREQAHQQHIGAGQHAGRRPYRISPHTTHGAIEDAVGGTVGRARSKYGTGATADILSR